MNGIISHVILSLARGTVRGRTGLVDTAVHRPWRPGLLWMLCLLSLMTGRETLGQSGALVEGTIYEAHTGQRLAGANIQILGTVLGTISDMQGNFAVGRVPTGNQHLRISMIGYRVAVLDVVVPTTDPLRVDMVTAAISLNPVVVTADRRPQTLDESSTSVTVLDRGQISARTDLRIDDALEMVPGVYFMEDDINIRGATGYRANAGNRALLLLDGVPIISSDTG